MKITYWEGEYGMLELIPFENNILFTSKDNEFIAVEGDYNESFISIREREIKINSFKSILKEKLTECEVFYLSDFGESSRSEETNGYVLSSDAAIFFYTNENYITEIWLKLDINRRQDAEVMFDLIKDIIAKYNLIYIDWGWKNIFTKDDQEALWKYFLKRIEVFEKIEDEKQIKKPKSWLKNILGW